MAGFPWRCSHPEPSNSSVNESVTLTTNKMRIRTLVDAMNSIIK
ncbi:hypothetical protein FMEAI12_930003 [Parafrankia sp. Ea1.12]|nr:hypothetical protein FMEAI12_930003 [Parafrankia sp. Ea1.12]